MAGYQHMTQAEWDELLRQRGYDYAADLADNFGTVIDETGLPPLAAPQASQSPLASATMGQPQAPQGPTTMTPQQGALSVAAPQEETPDLRKQLTGVYQEMADLPRVQQEENKLRFEQGQQRINQMYGGPSQSQMLFALSRALLSPRKFGGFKGTMANVSEALGGIADKSEIARQKREEALLRLQQSYDEGTAGTRAASLEGRRKLLEMQLEAEREAAKAGKRKLTVVPEGASLLDLEEIANLPVLTPQQYSAMRGNPQYKGFKFRTTDGRPMEIE